MSDAISRAIARTAAKRAAQPVLLSEVKIRVADRGIVVRGSGQLSFTRALDADPKQAVLLLYDPKLQAFRPVLVPPGTSWELVEKRQGSNLWKPGSST